jgi:phage virion morphogenesis protein
MAGVAVRLDKQAVQACLQTMLARAGDLSPCLRQFGQYMLGSIERNFAVGGRPTAWEPLKFATKVAWHTRRRSWWNKGGGGMTAKGRAAWEGRKPLTDTGRLRRSIQVAEVTPRSVTIGTNLVYAAIHQFGGLAGRGRKVRIPARPYLVFQKEDVRRAKEMLLAYLAGG